MSEQPKADAPFSHTEFRDLDGKLLCVDALTRERIMCAVVRDSPNPGAYRKPNYLYIETVSGQQFGVSESIEEDSCSEWEEFQKGHLRCFRVENGRFEELVGGTNWEPVKGWYRT